MIDTPEKLTQEYQNFLAGQPADLSSYLTRIHARYHKGAPGHVVLEEVTAVLAKSPIDLAAIEKTCHEHLKPGESYFTPLAIHLAEALHQAGKTSEAIAILKTAIEEEGKLGALLQAEIAVEQSVLDDRFTGCILSKFQIAASQKAAKESLALTAQILPSLQAQLTQYTKPTPSTTQQHVSGIATLTRNLLLAAHAIAPGLAMMVTGWLSTHIQNITAVMTSTVMMDALGATAMDAALEGRPLL